jgi:hypothetical protein
LKRIKNKSRDDKIRILTAELIAIRMTWNRPSLTLSNSFKKEDQVRIILNIAVNEFYKYKCMSHTIQEKDYVNLLTRGHAILNTPIPKCML